MYNILKSDAGKGKEFELTELHRELPGSDDFPGVFFLLQRQEQITTIASTPANIGSAIAKILPVLFPVNKRHQLI